MNFESLISKNLYFVRYDFLFFFLINFRIELFFFNFWNEELVIKTKKKEFYNNANISVHFIDVYDIFVVKWVKSDIINISENELLSLTIYIYNLNRMFRFNWNKLMLFFLLLLCLITYLHQLWICKLLKTFISAFFSTFNSNNWSIQNLWIVYMKTIVMQMFNSWRINLE